MKDMLNIKTWAVLGATKDKDKYGYKIFRRLVDKGYRVYGINPKYSDVDGIKIYSSINELPEVIGAISIIVKPQLALEALDSIKEKGIKNIWFQPGTFDQRVIEKAREMGFNIEYNKCIYIELK